MGLTVTWDEAAKQATFTNTEDTATESVVFTIDSDKYQHIVTEEGKDPVTEELTKGHRSRAEGQPHLCAGALPG